MTGAEDNVILYTALPNNPPMLIPATGGEPGAVPLERPERGFRLFPRLLPDGRHYCTNSSIRRRAGPRGCTFASLDTTDVREIVQDTSNGMYINGRLLFLQETALVAQPFDAATLQLQGTPVTIVEGVGFNAITYQGLYSVSGDVLAYLGATRSAQLVWFDRQGRSLGTLTPPGDYNTVCLTKNERGVVFEQADPASGTVDLWHVDLASRQATRLTFDPAIDFYPIWSVERIGPDGGLRVAAVGSAQPLPRVDRRARRREPILVRLPRRFLPTGPPADGPSCFRF